MIAGRRPSTARKSGAHLRSTRRLAAATPALVAALIGVASVPAAPTPARAERSLVRVANKGPGVIRALQRMGVDILAVTRQGTIDVAADEKQRDRILRMGIPAAVVATESSAPSAAALDANLGLYHTYAEMESVMTAWATTYPAILDVFSIGTSIEGRTLYAMKISDNVTVDETEPEVLFMGNHHAREIMSVEIPLRFAEYLLQNYGVVSWVTSMVDQREIYFVPMVNPDGHVYVENNHAGAWWTWWRKNRRINADLSVGVDINRNYGFNWGYDDIGSSPSPSSEVYRGTAAFSEPESDAIRAFAESREFTIWLSYHSYGELLLYPWGYAALFTPDHATFAALADSLTATNGYAPGNTALGTIYTVNGDTDDWGYGEQTTKGKVFAYTPEVNSEAEGGFGPADTVIDPTFNKLLRMNRLTLEYADNPFRVAGPFTPSQYAIASPYYPRHTLSWTGNVPSDPNPATHYDVERCTDPAFALDPAEALSSDWTFDGFSLDATAHTGTGSYYSGQGDNLSQALTAVRPYTVGAASDTFALWCTYDIELDWDYAYVEVSTDNGQTWATLAGSVTTASNPNGNNRGNGITGSSGGWVYAVFPLTAYAGQELAIRVSYITDGAVVNPGIWVDDIDGVPTCASVDLLATGVVDTTYDVTPPAVATYRYRVRAFDAESQASRWSATQTILVTTVSGVEAAAPAASTLGPASPNPFNPSTRIPFTVGELGSGGATVAVELKIFDVTGRRVAALVERPMAPGRYVARWNGRTDRGAALSTGVYFARLVVGGHAASTRKLLLLK